MVFSLRCTSFHLGDSLPAVASRAKADTSKAIAGILLVLLICVLGWHRVPFCHLLFFPDGVTPHLQLLHSATVAVSGTRKNIWTPVAKYGDVALHLAIVARLDLQSICRNVDRNSDAKGQLHFHSQFTSQIAIFICTKCLTEILICH